MILLDANYLIAAGQLGSTEFTQLVRWKENGEALGAPAIAWAEFLSGPVHPDDIADMQSLLNAGIFPFDEACASTAAHLFNATGRKRNLRVDGMIAATALENNACLATRNLADFQTFLAHGLRLAT